MSISVVFNDDDSDDLSVILVDHINSEKVIIPFNELDEVLKKVNDIKSQKRSNDFENRSDEQKREAYNKCHETFWVK